MSHLSQRSIDDTDTTKLSDEKIQSYLPDLPGWSLKDGKLFRHFDVANFKEARELVTKFANIADEANHHPDICFSYKYVDVTIYTHKIGGLTESDITLAARLSE